MPDATTATKIAVAVWAPLYGGDRIEGEKLYHATLEGDVWVVTGSVPEGYMGGYAIAKISKKDGPNIGYHSHAVTHLTNRSIATIEVGAFFLALHGLAILVRSLRDRRHRI